MRDSGIPEDPSPAKLEERAPGIPGESPPGEAGGCKNRGNPGLHRRESRKVRETGKPGDPPFGRRRRGCGETRSLTGGTAGRCRKRGNPEPHHEALLEEWGIGV